MMMSMMEEEEEGGRGGGEGNTQSSGPGLWGRRLSNTCLDMRQDERRSGVCQQETKKISEFGSRKEEEEGEEEDREETGA